LTVEQASFLQELFQRAGLALHAYRTETLRRRLPACLRAVRATSIRSARQILEKSPAMLHQAVEATVIGVTSFFRDIPVFAQLADDILPILSAKRGPIRVWSAGCSEGQELYSAAMLLGERELLGRSELLGTDCRAGAIAQAREGSYEAAVLNDVPMILRDRYFQPSVGTQHQLRAPLRERANWRRADVTQFAEPGPWDLIFCRNLTMYFQPAVAGQVWHRLEQSLRPGGFLVLGKAERPNGATRVAPYAPCIYRKIA
jgi:chemotaxis methyl-accepting protein methylase